MHFTHLTYQPWSLAQPTLNMLRTLMLDYSWATILSLTSRIIAFFSPEAGDSDGYFGCQNTTHNFQKTMAHCRLSMVYPLLIVWLTGRGGSLPLSRVSYRISLAQGKIKIRSMFSTECGSLSHHCKVEKL